MPRGQPAAAPVLAAWESGPGRPVGWAGLGGLAASEDRLAVAVVTTGSEQGQGPEHSVLVWDLTPTQHDGAGGAHSARRRSEPKR